MISSILIDILRFKSTSILLKLKVKRCFCCISCASFKDNDCGCICNLSKYDENIVVDIMINPFMKYYNIRTFSNL